MVDAPYCEACDSGHEVPCTCNTIKRPFIGRTEIQGKSMKCSSCQRSTLEAIEDQCETCYRRDKIEPLVALRELTLKEVARIDGLLTAKLEKLARNSRHNLNTPFHCVCGSIFKTGLDLISHLPECTGAVKPSTARSNGHAKLMKVDLSNVTEIG